MRPVATVTITSANNEISSVNQDEVPPPCSPEARQKSPTRMPLPPSILLIPNGVATLCEHTEFSTLPDPFAELEAVEREERIKRKNDLGPATVQSLTAIQDRYCCRRAVQMLHNFMQAQRQKDRMAKIELLQQRVACRLIVSALKSWKQRSLQKRRKLSGLVIARHRLQIVIGIRAWQRKVKAKLLRRFVMNHTMPRFCQVIHTMRWKAVKIQRFFRGYVEVTKARLRVLRIRFNRRVVERCNLIREENRQRVIEYEEEKLRIFHEQLRQTENEWHESHARVRNIILKATSAASRAKLRRRSTKIPRADNINLTQESATSNVACIKKRGILKKKKKKRNKDSGPIPEHLEKESLESRIAILKLRNDRVLKAKAKSSVNKIISKVISSLEISGDASQSNPDAPVLDALALQFMHLPPEIKKQLLRDILVQRRLEWSEKQRAIKRRYENQVETHRSINVRDIKDLISGKLEVSGLEKQTLIRFKYNPMKIYSRGIEKDLDKAIDIACQHCVWDF